VLNEFEGVYLDFHASFLIPSGQQQAYWADIGNVNELTNPRVAGSDGRKLPECSLKLPLPLLQTSGSDIALPVFLLPYVACKINFAFRDWSELLILDCVPSGEQEDNTQAGLSVAAEVGDLVAVPDSFQGAVFAHSYDLEPQTAAGMRETAHQFYVDTIHQNLAIKFEPGPLPASIDKISVGSLGKTAFFGARNTTNPAEWSNYTPASPVVTGKGVVFTTGFTIAPLEEVAFVRGGLKIQKGTSNFYSFVEPWVSGMTLPCVPGCYVWASTPQALDVGRKLGQDHIVIKPAPQWLVASGASGSLISPDQSLIPLGLGIQQTYELLLFYRSSILTRISGGVLSVIFSQ
jgi:hypothetical protein